MLMEPTDSIPVFPDHTRLKWLQRSAEPDKLLSTAWEESVPVGIPGGVPYGPRMRLHPPSGTLLVYALAQETSAKYVVRTVLEVDLYEAEYDLNDDHLRVCDACGLRYEGGDACPWCGEGAEDA